MIGIDIYEGTTKILHNGKSPDTDTLEPVRWRTGRDYNGQDIGYCIAGEATFSMLNTERQWDRVQSGNFVEIKLQGTIVWGGIVDQAENILWEHRTVRQIQCLGPLFLLAATELWIEPIQSITATTALQTILTRCGVPPRFHGTVQGDEHLLFFWADGEDGLTVARRLEATARGYLYEDSQGRINLASQSSRTGIGTPIELSEIALFRSEERSTRRTTGVKGHLWSMHTDPVETILEVPATHTDLPIPIPARSSAHSNWPVPLTFETVGVWNTDSVTLQPSTLAGNATRSGRYLRVEAINNTDATVGLTSIEVTGQFLIATEGREVTQGSGPVFHPLPPHLITDGATLQLLLSHIIAAQSRGHYVATTRWYGASDRAVARTLHLNQRLQLLDAIYILEAMEHEYNRGAEHTVDLILTHLSDYTNNFTLGESRLNGGDRLL